MMDDQSLIESMEEFENDRLFGGNRGCFGKTIGLPRTNWQ